MADELATAKDILDELHRAELSEQSWEAVRQVLDGLAAKPDPLAPREIAEAVARIAQEFGNRAGRIDASPKSRGAEPVLRRVGELVHRIGGLGEPATPPTPKQSGSKDDSVRA